MQLRTIVNTSSKSTTQFLESHAPCLVSSKGMEARRGHLEAEVELAFLFPGTR